MLFVNGPSSYGQGACYVNEQLGATTGPIVTVADAMTIPEAARTLLRKAMELHTGEDIDGALAAAREALDLAPGYADARQYIGSTLVQRLGRYAEGLAELERAARDAPDDPAAFYTLGWCDEFVAHRITRRPVAGLDPSVLYEKAEDALRRCLQLKPQGKLRDDASELLASIIREDVE
jgi:tetratricopeptide (TPR) repeat protein